MKIEEKYFHLERVIWITGLSGSGKTTVADILGHRLSNNEGKKVLRLDGDKMREALKNCDSMSKYDPESRLKNALTYSALAKSLISQFDYIIVSTISMFRDVFSTNREVFNNYFEVYLDVPHSERSSRDPKGLYRCFETESDSGFFAESLKFDIPTEAHFFYSHDVNDTAKDVAQKIEILSHQYFENIFKRC